MAGQTVPYLRWVAVLAPRSGQGPQGVPTNRSAAAADVVTAAQDPDYRLTVRVGDRERQFTRDELGGAVQFDSLERGGLYCSSVLPQRHAVDDSTLIALTLNGETLHIDHGFPCRLIAPSHLGVLQTKWLSRIEVRP